MKYLLITISLFALACSKPVMYECQETTYTNNGNTYYTYPMEFKNAEEMERYLSAANSNAGNRYTHCYIP